MAFTSTMQVTEGTAVITLTGELDAAVAPAFRADIEQAAAQKPRRLVLIVKDLDYMASAGLRALIFAKQKMGEGVEIVLAGVQPNVLETIQLTGFQRSVIFVDSYANIAG